MMLMPTRPAVAGALILGLGLLFRPCVETSLAAASQATYSNPVLPGDFPDPSVIRVGRDYWATATTFYIYFAARKKDGPLAISVATAEKPQGPWTDHGPLIGQAAGSLDADTAWRCPGHGSIVSTPEGRDLLLYHAYHAGTFTYVGRQGSLDEVKWGADGWLTINEGRGPSTTAEAAVALAAPRTAGHFFDDFEEQTLKGEWQWPVNREPMVKLARGYLTLTARAGQAHGDDLLDAALGLPTTGGDYTASTVLDARSLQPGVQAGLTAFGDSANAIGLTIGDNTLQLWRRQKGKHTTLATRPMPGARVISLRMTATGGHKFRFSFRHGRAWERIGADIDLEGDYLPPRDRGIRVALVTGGTEKAAAKFDWVRLVRGTNGAAGDESLR